MKNGNIINYKTINRKPMRTQVPIVYYAHWKELLVIAKNLQRTTSVVPSRRLANNAACIMLSRNAIEVYVNEVYASINKNSPTREEFLKFIERHICDRYKSILLLSGGSENIKIYNDLDAMNKIRNYCIHYSAPFVKQDTRKLINCHPYLKKIYKDDNKQELVQIYLINEKIAKWSINIVLNSIKYYEKNRTIKSPVSRENLEFCKEFWRTRND